MVNPETGWYKYAYGIYTVKIKPFRKQLIDTGGNTCFPDSF